MKLVPQIVHVHLTFPNDVFPQFLTSALHLGQKTLYSENNSIFFIDSLIDNLISHHKKIKRMGFNIMEKSKIFSFLLSLYFAIKSIRHMRKTTG